MAWCQCVCTHHRAHHPYLGRFGGYKYGGCELCQICEKPSKEHVFVAHQFTRCACPEYAETCDSVLPKWKRNCTLVKGHEGQHRQCEVSWTDETAQETA